MTEPQEVWYTVERVAEIMQLHPQTVRRMIREGKLRATDLGKKAGYRVAASDLHEYMTRNVYVVTDAKGGDR